MKLSSLFGSIALVAALGGMALAQDKSGLKDWAGEYVSADAFLSAPQADEFCQKVVDEAKKAGKDVTADQVKENVGGQFESQFKSALIDESGITFEIKEDGQSIHVDYEFKGAVSAADGTKWYAFDAKEAPADSKLSHVILSALSGDPEQLQIRCGEGSAAELADNPGAAWCSVLFHKDLAPADFLSKLDPAAVAEKME